MAQVRNETILRYLGGEGEGPGGVVGASVRDGAVSARLGDAWNTKGGVRVAKEGEWLTGYRGGPRGGGGGGGFGDGSGDGSGGDGSGGGGGNTYQKLSADDIKGTGAIKTAPVASGEREQEAAVKIRIGGTLGAVAGMGKIDRAAVDGIFRRRMGAVKACYERALKVNQAVEGKVTVRVTVGMAGTVTAVEVLENTTGDAQIAACIAEKVKAFPFPPPEEGSVLVTQTFLLHAG